MKFVGLRITDSVVGGLSIVDNKKGLFKVADSEGMHNVNGKSLVVTIPMTHAGIKTRNYGVYLPSRMMNGASSFTDDYEKPIIVGHGNSGMFSSGADPEPIGRVKSAHYVDTSAELLNKDSKLKDLYMRHLGKDPEDSHKAGMDMTKHLMKKYIMKDKKDYQGLGHLKGTLNFTDPEAIQKVMDGRYLTVSVSATSKTAYCGTCGQNLVKDGVCEHSRGEMQEDGMPTVIVPGDLHYEHLAIVNTPADPHASRFELYNEQNEATAIRRATANPPAGIANSSAELDAAAKCFIYYNTDKILSMDSDQEINIVRLDDAVGGVVEVMAKKNTAPVAEPVKTEVVVNDNGVAAIPATPVINVGAPGGIVAIPPFVPVVPQDSVVVPPSVVVEDTAVTPDPLKEIIAKLKDKLQIPAEDLRFAAEFFKLASEDNADGKAALGISKDEKYNEDKLTEYLVNFKKFYDQCIPWDALVAEDGYKYFEEILEADAKLSSEKRKSLKGSTFCGPGRSFPVPDCAHVTAARRLIGRAKVGSSTKDKILACVSRKSKSLGCGGSKDSTDSTVLDNGTTACDNATVNQDVTKITDAELISKLADFKKELLLRGLQDNCSSCVEKDQQLEIVSAQLDAVNEEVDLLVQDSADSEEKFKQQLAERVVDMKILSGEVIADRIVAIGEHKGRATVSLQDSLKDLEGKVNLSKITAKINDGISQEPTGTVVNPVLQSAATESGSGKTTTTEQDSKKENHKVIYETYNNICEKYGRKHADKYIESMKAQGLVSE